MPAGHSEGFGETFRELYRAVYRAVAAGGPPAEPDYPTFSDGHDTGLYTLEHLRALCQCPACRPDAGAPPGPV